MQKIHCSNSLFLIASHTNVFLLLLLLLLLLVSLLLDNTFVILFSFMRILERLIVLCVLLYFYILLTLNKKYMRIHIYDSRILATKCTRPIKWLGLIKYRRRLRKSEWVELLQVSRSILFQISYC